MHKGFSGHERIKEGSLKLKKLSNIFAKKGSFFLHYESKKVIAFSYMLISEPNLAEDATPL